MAYLKWNEKTITDFSDENINSLYNQGYLFGRTGKGEMYQTRSLRIDLSKFKPNSENRRVMNKVTDVLWEIFELPYPPECYDWRIGKLAKDFYETKFGPKTFSANKIKELIIEPTSNFNTLFVYSTSKDPETEKNIVGYAICCSTNDILHYSYPFYRLDTGIPNLGLGMMLAAIVCAQEVKKKYVYLGSFSRPTDSYKLQFAGLEWWDGKEWKNDLEELKDTLT